MADPSGFFDQSLLPALAQLLAELGQSAPPGGSPRPRKIASLSFTKTIVPMLFHDSDNISIRADIDRVYRIGFTVRDRISLDAWRILTRLRDRFSQPTMEANETLDLLNDTILILDACSGQAGEGMTREKGWRFLDIGRRIVRSLSLINLFQFGLSHTDAHEPQRLTAILEIANSLMTYRSRYGATTEATAVLDLLMLDESNPRSLTFQFMQIQEHLEQIAPPASASQRPTELRIAMGLLATTQLTEIEQLVSTITRSRRTALIRLMTQMKEELDALSTALTHTYLSHAQAPRPLTHFGMGSIS